MSPISDAGLIAHGQTVVFTGLLSSHLTSYFVRKSPVLSGSIIDTNNHAVRFSVFTSNDSELATWLREHAEKVVTVKAVVNTKNNHTYLNSVQPVPITQQGKIIANYKLPKKLQGSFHQWLKDNFDELLIETVTAIREKIAQLGYSPGQLRQLLNAQGLTLERVIEMLHYPGSRQDAELARQVMERLMCLLLLNDTEASPRLAHPLQVSSNWQAYSHTLPYQLTDEQAQAVSGILHGVNDRHPKSVLLGDVGTGKTVVASLVVKSVVAAGGRAAIMVPNLVLGAQIYQEIDQFWPELNIHFLLSEQEQKNFGQQGYRTIGDLDEQFSAVIGTTALLHHHNNVELDLLWCDEEQKLGLEQKEDTLITEGRTHLLLSSATCIPRTQAMMQFGFLPFYRLTKYHNDRQVVTTLFKHDEMAKVISRTQSVIDSGGKVLMICTKKHTSSQQSENSPNNHRLDAEQLYRDWSAFYPGKVVLSHGGLSKTDNETALNAIKQGPAQLLVATTLVEVGITIPGLMYVVVLNPENLGVVTLHQIRGRVARQGGTGYCDLLPTRDIRPDTKARLDLLVNHADGFTLADADLKMRGMGDIGGGENQSGTTRGLLIDCQVDVGLMEEMITWVECDEEMKK
ncbi:helicase-related protein [uncultured Photobacterium sp.]|uniref:helicase-related protein n=1 Tax=uncultured Photobacterium sp. TaxID=173973 RepID=UPI002614B3F8|nr:helicase-related protein [uncultured Photobacterium sp.]